MRVKLTLRRPGAPLTDIVVMADSTATVADVARQIATTDPLRSTVTRTGDTLSLSVAAPTPTTSSTAARSVATSASSRSSHRGARTSSTRCS